jgi:CheY-like chemotaxis protein
MKSAAKVAAEPLPARLNQPLPFHRLGTSAVEKARLLIVSDDAERLASWRAILPERQWEITGIAAPSWLGYFRHRVFDLAIVDIAAPELAAVLQAIRVTHAQIPVLVEASRLPDDLTYAGLLPQYRAMSCAHVELVRLVKNYFATDAKTFLAKPSPRLL